MMSFKTLLDCINLLCAFASDIGQALAQFQHTLCSL